LRTSEENVREAVLHACGDAVSYYDLPSALFEPLAPLMLRLAVELIGYVLAILGATHDPAARSIVEPYASHPDAAVREEAVDALVEIGGRPS
jgi:HEAT repeat protein